MPRLVLQGTRDTFGTAEELADQLPAEASAGTPGTASASSRCRAPTTAAGCCKGGSPTAAELREQVVRTTGAFVRVLVAAAE